MKIYLVQSASKHSLGGSNGYSYGLLAGDQKLLLVSFVNYMEAKEHDILFGNRVNRRRLIDRSDKKPPK